MTANKRLTILVWVYFGVIAVLNSIGVLLDRQAQGTIYQRSVIDFLFPAMLIAFAFVGALIVSHQPHNRIGLLLLLPGTSFAPFTDGALAMFVNGLWPVPNPPTPLFLILIWFATWNWVLLIFPLLYILVLFPTGHLLSSHWRWLLYLITFEGLAIPIFTTFGRSLAPPQYENWSFSNPLGFLTIEQIEAFLPIFAVALPLCVLLSVATLFVRFRQARGVERDQIKWLFLAGAVFAAAYIPSFIVDSFADDSIWNALWVFGMMAIPVAVGIAILRYRLYDIDLIIRKTVQYAVITAVLALVYFGTVVVLQTLIGQATGEQSPIIIVVSTLLIAALFNPLRRRVQTAVDRRFYRKKYDAQQVLAQFAQTARDEVEMEALQTELLHVVQETMQPATVSIWLKSDGS